MKKIDLKELKELRQATGAGVGDVKEALLKGGSFDKALKLLQKKGAKILEQKKERASTQGIVASYIHLGGKVGAMVELRCETDFVAKSEPFKKLAYDIAVQIAGMNPKYLEAKDVPAAEKKKAKDFDAFCREYCLMQQTLIKDSSKTVEELLHEAALQVKENIGIVRFVRFAVGGEVN